MVRSHEHRHKRTRTIRACLKTSPCLHRVFLGYGTLASPSMYFQYISDSSSAPRHKNSRFGSGTVGFETYSSRGGISLI